MNYNTKQNTYIDAYNTTMYVVFNPSIVIEVEKRSKELDEFLHKHNVIEWTFITSLNPYSNQLTDEENEILFNSLLKDIAGYTYFLGQGEGADKSWEPEKSVLIIGISESEAILLGNKYNQNAIIVGEKGSIAKLVLLKAFEDIH